MQLTPIEGKTNLTADTASHDLALAERLAAASQGDVAALFDLGVAYSTASDGAPSDLVDAHKWFNLAAARGQEEAGWSRA
ncbi:MAG: hypothetical protein RIC51_12790, partial [Erythrobacter sp.]